MRLLFIGDVVGDRGVHMIETYLPQLKRDYKPQATIVNGENSTPVGRGISQAIYKTLLASGADVVTMGNHTWDNKEIFEFIDGTTKLVRPANYPGKDVPGRGWTQLKVNQATLAVINLQGRVFLPPLDDPFTAADALVTEIRKTTPIIFLDFHAEATSEKTRDGDLSSGKGVRSCWDAHPRTDHGWSDLTWWDSIYDGCRDDWPDNGILGMQSEGVISRFLTQRPTRYVVDEDEKSILSGCVIDINDQNGQATKIKPILISDAHPYFN
ncbi:TIGR00282 family metallophosphoesterase [Secundilactobacillus paracollinoides]|uniref:TIGR00282 family metallophosphoesterase n=1 Tax=Secundilactobacillus paracollinoides TaxID=240427 RepID=UPI000A5F0382